MGKEKIVRIFIVWFRWFDSIHESSSEEGDDKHVIGKLKVKGTEKLHSNWVFAVWMKNISEQWCNDDESNWLHLLHLQHRENMQEFYFFCALGIIFIFCRVQIIYVSSTATAHRVEELFSGSRCRTASARAAKFDFDTRCLKHEFISRYSKSAQQLGERWRVTRMLDLNF